MVCADATRAHLRAHLMNLNKKKRRQRRLPVVLDDVTTPRTSTTTTATAATRPCATRNSLPPFGLVLPLAGGVTSGNGGALNLFFLLPKWFNYK